MNLAPLPAQPGMPLGQRLLAAGAPPELHRLPPGSRVEITEDDGLLLTFPSRLPGMGWIAFALGVPVLLMSFFWAVVPYPGIVVAIALPALVLTAFLAWFVANAPRERIRVGVDAVEARAWRRRRVPLDALTDVSADHGRVLLVAHGRHAMFATGLRKGEARAIASAVALAAHRHAGGLSSLGPAWADRLRAPPGRARRDGDPDDESGQRRLLLVGALLLLVGGVQLALAMYLLRKTSAFMGRAVPTSGTVVDLQASGLRRTRVYHPVIRYQTSDGVKREFQGREGSSPPRYRVGESVEVLYDPGNLDACIAGTFSVWGPAWILFGAGSLLTTIGLVIVVRSVRSRRRSIRAG